MSYEEMVHVDRLEIVGDDCLSVTIKKMDGKWY
jgi:hypothetical protein